MANLTSTRSAVSSRTEVIPPVDRIRFWGERRDWRGWDPYDALNAPIAPVLTLGTALGRRVLTQAVKRSPLNLRPLLGIQPSWNAKAIGLVASGYARLYAARADPALRRECERWLAWLVEHGRERGFAWGYHFEVQTRFFRYGREAPNTIATSFVGSALLDGWEFCRDERWLDAARRSAEFLLVSMLTEGDRPYFRYLPGESCLVHNANALAASLVVRLGLATDDRALTTTGLDALRVTVDAQQADGSWAYAELPGQGWIDNFHTAYVLESLASAGAADASLVEPLFRGASFWERQLFTPQGRPKYFVNSTYPLDAHCYADAVEAWVALSPWRSDALERAARAAAVLVADMLERDGHVVLQRGRLYANRVPCIRWSAAPAFRALAGLELANAGDE